MSKISDKALAEKNSDNFQYRTIGYKYSIKYSKVALEQNTKQIFDLLSYRKCNTKSYKTGVANMFQIKVCNSFTYT